MISLTVEPPALGICQNTGWSPASTGSQLSLKPSREGYGIVPPPIGEPLFEEVMTTLLLGLAIAWSCCDIASPFISCGLFSAGGWDELSLDCNTPILSTFFIISFIPPFILKFSCVDWDGACWWTICWLWSLLGIGAFFCAWDQSPCSWLWLTFPSNVGSL